MDWVLDTNILVSALIWNGPPHQVFEQGFATGVRFHTSPILLDELHATLNHPKLIKIQQARNLNPADLFDAARVILRCMESPPLPTPVCRDPDDDAVLACALAAGADLIVSGDADLLSLRHFRDIPIITAVQALTRL